MRRGRRLVLVSHCILNQNAVVHPLARTEGAFTEAATAMVRAGVGILQLPCPEAAFGGLARPSQSRAEYDTPPYRRLCASLAQRVETELAPLLSDGCQVVGLVGIDGSPSCAVREPVGLWFAQLRRLADLAGIPALGIPEEESGGGEEFLDRLRAMLVGGCKS